jgi:hypothetical protein
MRWRMSTENKSKMLSQCARIPIRNGYQSLIALFDLGKQLSDKIQALVAKQTQCDRLAQHASDTKDEEAIPLVDAAIAWEMAKLK